MPYLQSRMLTALTLLLVIAGLGLFAEFPVMAIACCCAAYGLHRVAIKDEDGFVAFVMILAALFSVITTVQALADAIGH